MESSNHVYDGRRTWGKMAVDSQERVNFERLRKERLHRAKESMKRHDLDAILLLDGKNIRYVSGVYDYDWRALLRYCVLPREGEPVMFEPVGPDMQVAINNSVWIKDFRPAMAWLNSLSAEQYMTERFATSVKKALEDYKVVDGKVGVDTIPPGPARELAKVGVNASDGRTPMMEARMIKTRDELELLKLACAAVDSSFWNARHGWVKPGMRECEIKGAFSNFHLSNGCEEYKGNVAAGPNSSPYHRGGATDYMLRPGDMIIIDSIPQYYGYYADFVRCWVVGDRPSKEQKEVYRQCYDSLQNVIRAIRPGATSADMAKGFIEDEEATNGTTSMVNGSHSVGLAPMEAPYITRAYSFKYPETIKQNMFLAIETYVHSADWKHSARLEENVVVTETGCESYSKAPFEEEMLS